MFNVVLDNNTIEQYDQLLSRFSNWMAYKREIKLNTLLESGKKIEFKVDIENHQFGGTYITIDYGNFDFDVNLKNVCAVTKSMTFIIQNYKIESLKLEINILSTDKGKIISDLIKSIDLELNQKLVDDSVLGFFFKIHNQVA